MKSKLFIISAILPILLSMSMPVETFAEEKLTGVKIDDNNKDQPLFAILEGNTKTDMSNVGKHKDFKNKPNRTTLETVWTNQTKIIDYKTESKFDVHMFPIVRAYGEKTMGFRINCQYNGLNKIEYQDPILLFEDLDSGTIYVNTNLDIPHYNYKAYKGQTVYIKKDQYNNKYFLPDGEYDLKLVIYVYNSQGSDIEDKCDVYMTNDSFRVTVRDNDILPYMGDNISPTVTYDFSETSCTIKVTDTGGSGVDSITVDNRRYAGDTYTLAKAEGLNDHTIYAMDKAGNKSEVKKVSGSDFKPKDQVPPNLVVTPPQEPDRWIKPSEGIEFTVSATDDKSGISKIEYKVDKETSTFSSTLSKILGLRLNSLFNI